MLFRCLVLLYGGFIELITWCMLSLSFVLLVLQYSFLCCLWFTLLLRLYFKTFFCGDLSKVDGHTPSSILVLSFLLMVFCSICKDIPDFLLYCIAMVHIRRRLNPAVLLWSLVLHLLSNSYPYRFCLCMPTPLSL